MIPASSLPRGALNTCRCSEVLQAKREKFFVSLSALKAAARSSCVCVFGILGSWVWSGLPWGTALDQSLGCKHPEHLTSDYHSLELDLTALRKEVSEQPAPRISLETPLPVLLSVSFQENITALLIKSPLGQIVISCWRWVQRMHCQVSSWISKFFPWCNILICCGGILKCGITCKREFCHTVKHGCLCLLFVALTKTIWL